MAGSIFIETRNHQIEVEGLDAVVVVAGMMYLRRHDRRISQLLHLQLSRATSQHSRQLLLRSIPCLNLPRESRGPNK
jgi:hypothetical protein